MHWGLSFRKHERADAVRQTHELSFFHTAPPPDWGRAVHGPDLSMGRRALLSFKEGSKMSSDRVSLTAGALAALQSRLPPNVLNCPLRAVAHKPLRVLG